MPFWNKRDQSGGHDKPKRRESGNTDPYPIELVGSPEFQARVKRLSAVLAASLNQTEWAANIDNLKTSSGYLTALTWAVYNVLSQENGAGQTHRGDPFAYLPSDENTSPGTMKAYLQLRPENKAATEAIATSIQTQIKKRGMQLAGKFDRFPESNRRDRIVFYFHPEDRGKILPLLSELASDLVTDPGPLRDISPQVSSGINYAVDPNKAWNTFVSLCIPEDGKYVFSYRRMFAFFSAIEVAQHILNSRGKDQKSKELQQYISAVAEAVKDFNKDPQEAYAKFMKRMNPRG
ncbi:hypothetical protein KBD71_04930 [Candidatus Woesebacteria bacterium]|nr:hypothetical protein [Candidatus Woesebacteria bacterium]